ncbi:hypothetical protein ElyMa_001064100 [Elysia marginata]|uniref:Uncharacterized protein n=1 Tax=Elysia marginata TaxID=1093978 RepID=A0AAV4HTU0_9GAST|nr:hypothetical protein ElyMa_001064100 [Elysia marginata]
MHKLRSGMYQELDSSYDIKPRRTHLGTVVRPAVDDLRRGVQRTSTERGQHTAMTVVVGQSKVCDLSKQKKASGQRSVWYIS